jgi:HEAT repeat protein
MSRARRPIDAGAPSRKTDGPQSHSSTSVAELVRGALQEYDPQQEREQPFISALRRRGDQEVLDAMRRLAKSDRSEERALAADVLGELGIPDRTFPRECGALLAEMLGSEHNPMVLTAVGHALGRLTDERGVQPLVRLSSHPADDVRLAVVHGLLGQEDGKAIDALIQLTTDPAEMVRDWATFGLGNQIDVDRKDIREALAERLTDDDECIRREAAIGLARRGDVRAVAPILGLIRDETDDPILEEAVFRLAATVRDDRLEKALSNIRSRWTPEAIAAVTEDIRDKRGPMHRG